MKLTEFFQPKTFTELNELADRPYPFKYNGSFDGNDIFRFTTEKEKDYDVLIRKEGQGISILFGQQDLGLLNVGRTKTGDSFRVFSTVIEIIKSYVNQHQPEMILFSSDRDEVSRTNLYYKFAKRASQVLPNYELGSVDVEPHTVYFQINKKKGSISESITVEDFQKILKDFLPLAQNVIKLEKLPKIILRKKIEDGEQPTHGRFFSDQYVLEIAIGNRQPVDVLRTLAHELVHAKQQLDGVNIDPTTGSKDENEANAVAGIVMRHFNKKYPEYLSYQPLEEGLKNGRERIFRKNKQH